MPSDLLKVTTNRLKMVSDSSKKETKTIQQRGFASGQPPTTDQSVTSLSTAEQTGPLLILSLYSYMASSGRGLYMLPVQILARMVKTPGVAGAQLLYRTTTRQSLVQAQW